MPAGRTGCQMRRQRLEDRVLHVLLLGRRLDHQVGIAERGVVGGGRGCAPAPRPLSSSDDQLAVDLPVHVAGDRGQGAFAARPA